MSTPTRTQGAASLERFVRRLLRRVARRYGLRIRRVPRWCPHLDDVDEAFMIWDALPRLVCVDCADAEYLEDRSILIDHYAARGGRLCIEAYYAGDSREVGRIQ